MFNFCYRLVFCNSSPSSLIDVFSTADIYTLVKLQSSSTPDGSAECSPQACRVHPDLRNPSLDCRKYSAEVALLRAQTHQHYAAELQKKEQARAITGYSAKLLYIPT